ncbi:extracellular solute-binding protein [bacterium]|nr:extracellular solute-binding protein [bacterium]
MRWWIWLWLLTCACWAQPVEVALFEGGEGLEYFQRCAQEMGNVTLYGDPRISEKVRIRLLEGAPPEVSNANLPYEQLIAKGKIQALDSWLDGPNWDGSGRWRDDFLPGSLERFTVRGHVYGIPLQYTIQAVYYNKALFAKNAWRPPDTWRQWVQLCQKIKSSGRAPLAFQGRYTYYASPLIHHAYYCLAGPQAYREQLQLKAGSFDNPAMIESLRLVQQLAQDYFQPGSMGMSHTEAQLEFLQGHAAMLVCGSWFKSEMRGKFPVDFQLGEFPIPNPSDRPHRAVQVGAGYYFVFAQSAHPQGGVNYLRYITRRSHALQLVKTQDLPVAVVGANRALSPDLEGLARVLEQATSSFGEDMASTHPGMAQVWSDVRFDLLHNRATPEKLARQLEVGAARLGRDPHQVGVLYPWRPWLLGLVILVLVSLGRSPKPSHQALRQLPLLDLLLLAAPPLLIYALFFLLPSLAALIASGCEWDGLGPPSWVGTFNFRNLLQASPRFWRALGNNLFLMACVPTLITAWSLLFAVLLQPDQRRHKWLRALYFFPHLLGIGSILVWQQLYHPQGPLNQLLVKVGLTGFSNYTWLSQDHLYPSMLPLALWSAGGFQLVLCSAALTQVPGELYEAARLEGANRWQQFWAVSWPYLRSTVLAGYFLLLISAVKSFETVWLFTNQEPTTQVHVLGTLLMQTAFAELRLGEATALAVILLALVLALQAALSRWEEDD